MKNWQDYITNVNTAQSNNAQTNNCPSKVWLYLNSFLTCLCVIALFYGIYRTNIEGGGLIGILRYAALTLYLPSMIIATLPTGGNINAQFSIYAQITYTIVSLALIINFIFAVIFYYKNHQSDNSNWRYNLILSTPPAILAIIAILIQYF